MPNRIARAARRRHRALERLCLQLPEPAVLWRRRRIVQLNSAARTLLGCGTGWPDGQMLQALMAALPCRGVQPSADMATVQRSDGLQCTRRVSVVPLRWPGGGTALWLLHDNTAGNDLQARLQQSQDRLAQLSAAIDAEQQGRRRHAARRVHDELLQPLVAMRMNLEVAAAGIAGLLPEAAAPLRASIGIGRAAILAGRDIVRTLGSPVLADLGLVAALEALAADFRRQHRIPCSLRVRGVHADHATVASAAVLCLYRVAEEALDNVARHARARQVGLRLAGDPHGGLSLQIRDDGVGMGPRGRSGAPTIGLPVLEHRVQALGGTLTLRSAPGAGTRLTARLRAGGRPPGPGESAQDAHEAALTRFFYRAPVGLVQAGIDGQIEVMNPRAACCLLTLSRDGRVDNLFTVLAGAVPQLAAQARSLQQPDGVLCDGLHVPRGPAQPLWLTVTKQAGTRWMAVLLEPVGAPVVAGAATLAAG